MKRKMIGAAAAYMAGLFFASFFTGIRELILLVVIAAVVFLVCRYKGLKQNDFAFIAACFAAAFFIGEMYNIFHYDKVVAYDGADGSFEGEVIDISCYNDDKASYVLEGYIDGIKSAKITLYGQNLGAEYGDHIAIESCTFEIPQSDYLFDSESYHKSEGVFLSAESAEGVTLKKTDSQKFKNTLMSYRERMISEFRIVLGNDSGDFLSGMVFGEKQGMDDNVKTALYRSGIGHVLAVSGLHVSIIAIALMSLLNALRVNRFVTFGAVNILLILLIIMANSPVSAIRAAIMVNFLNSARLFRRQNDSFNSLSAAILLICLVNPYVIYSSGFLLSAAGTFGIAVFGPYMTKNIPDSNFLWKLLRSVLIMLCTTLAIMPLSMKYFDEVSLISPFTNVLLVPLCSIAMLFGVIHIITGGAVSLVSAAGALIDVILEVTDKLARLKIAYLSCGSEDLIIIAFACTAIVIIVHVICEKRLYTCVSTLLACSLVFLSSAINAGIRYKSFRIAVLGRGSNAAIVISYHGKTEIIDLSGHYKSADYVRKYITENAVSSVESVSLTADVQSQYAAYVKALDFVPADKWIAAGEVPVYGAEMTLYFGETGYYYDNGAYSVDFEDGVLVISYEGSEVEFLPAASAISDSDGLSVYYGNIPKSAAAVSSESTIYLDKNEENSINNFEIILSENGRCRIRRL